MLLAGMACVQVGLRELHRFGAAGGKCCHMSLLPVSALQRLSDPLERHLGNTLEGWTDTTCGFLICTYEVK